MTRSLASLSISVSLCLATALPAAAQAALEAGLGAARAVTTTAPAAAGIGKSISGAFDKALKSVPQASKDQPATTRAATAPNPAAKELTASATASPVPAPAPKPNWEDPDGIEKGLSHEDLLRRFGPPAMSIAGSAQLSLTYQGKDGMFQVEVRDGLVASVAKPQQ